MWKFVSQIILLGVWAVLEACTLLSSGNWQALSGVFPIVSQENPEFQIKNAEAFFQEHPFSGTLLRWDRTGRIRSLTLYREGRREGPQVLWFKDGHLQSIRFYRQNRPVGLHLGFWPNGQLKFAYPFSEGLLAGLALDWHENGRDFMKRNYLAGRETGLQKAWGPEGKIFSSYVVKGAKRYGLVGSKPCFTVH